MSKKHLSISDIRRGISNNKLTDSFESLRSTYLKLIMA